MNIPSIKEQFIGKKITIISSSLPLKDSEGIIVDETKTLFRIKQENKIRTFPKKGLCFMLTNTNTIIQGDTLLKSPEERIKLRIQK